MKEFFAGVGIVLIIFAVFAAFIGVMSKDTRGRVRCWDPSGSIVIDEVSDHVRVGRSKIEFKDADGKWTETTLRCTVEDR